MIWLVLAAITFALCFTDPTPPKSYDPAARASWRSYWATAFTNGAGSVFFIYCLLRGLTELGMLHL